MDHRVPSPRPPREATAPPVADRVPAVLRQLAAERATGALLRDRGTLYLVEGRVVGAESPAAPAPEHLFSGGDAPGRGEMEICRLAALFDAAYFALDAAGGPARFHPGVTVPDPSRAVRPIGIETVARETRRRRRLLHGLWPCPEVDVAPVVPIAVEDLPEGSTAAVTPRRRAVLDLADGIRTPADIARELGRLAFHTLVDVRRLAAAGYVETPRAAPLAPPVAPPGPVEGSPRSAAPFATGPHPGGPAPAGLGTAAGIAGITAGSGSGEADIALLRRLRDALEAHL
ncbi:transcriptional regulator [Streptomyces sp. ST2-7A]|uniref:transcriptional regulator n=1 Tax=Streptomyces sp. ST2-7A TaxID=2907214 RepID=UPI001F161374|nr:transcriptional regulator [Streptomyces sp. ST2-7A]MCE7082701.1 transcriptional regulator [Streptomyces sp. ST2-7A]